MKRIYKYMIPVHAENEQAIVALPLDAEILSVVQQRGDIFIWALVTPSGQLINRSFQVLGTGWNIEDDVPRKFIGTVFIEEFIFHVFELL